MVPITDLAAIRRRATKAILLSVVQTVGLGGTATGQ
jgi:hypothetical protein